ncbi:MAG: hypothetical protein AB9903_33205 [Vulcanimicrobiota bacterium]
MPIADSRESDRRFQGCRSPIPGKAIADSRDADHRFQGKRSPIPGMPIADSRESDLPIGWPDSHPEITVS